MDGHHSWNLISSPKHFCSHWPCLFLPWNVFQLVMKGRPLFFLYPVFFWCVAPWSANRRLGEMGAGEQDGCRRAQRGDFSDEWRLGFKVIEKCYTDSVCGEYQSKRRGRGAVGHVLRLRAEKRGHLVAILAMMEWQVPPQHLRLRQSEEVIQSLCTPGWSLWSFQHLSIQMT